MARSTILVVEDDMDISNLLSYNLEKEGYKGIQASSGEKALDLLQREPIDLVLLDIMLPGIDGLEVCRRICGNKKTATIPILILTAKGEDSDIITGLELGAKDYVTKPFSPKVLIARIRSILRASDEEETDKQHVSIHGLDIDIAKHSVRNENKSLNLSVTEFDILVFLANNPGWVFSREKIINAIKGQNYVVTARTVDVQILGLRRKLGKKGDIIETVRGVGYRMKEFLD